MGKPQRRLREFNNQNRTFWGYPPLPEPEDGFAEEPPPPHAKLIAQAEEWFRNATTGQPARPRKPKIPAPQHLEQIARLVWQWRENMPPPGPEQKAALVENRKLQRAVACMLDALDLELRAVLPDETMRDDPAVTRLVDLWNAAKLAEPYIGRAPRQGERYEAWHVMARALKGPVETALKSTGLTRVAVAPNGPLVKIIRDALTAVDGKMRRTATIVSYLNLHKGWV